MWNFIKEELQMEMMECDDASKTMLKWWGKVYMLLYDNQINMLVYKVFLYIRTYLVMISYFNLYYNVFNGVKRNFCLHN